VSFVYLADVYVLEEYRGRGLGEALVEFMLDDAELANVRWILHTTNMHALYRKFGFTEPDYKVMERRASNHSSDSG
jgi:GNAT superfamily N-acetyltransferase